MTNTRQNLNCLSNSSGAGIKWLLYIVVFAFSLLFTQFAEAVGTPPPNGPGGPGTGNYYQIQEGDYFTNFLMKGMLGKDIHLDSDDAEGTFGGQGNLGAIFREFNLGVSFFASLIIIFLAVVGILNSGQDGEFLGRKWSSFWVPFRFATGAALMLPVTNAGYSFVQALCIWIAGQGVGFANNVWGAIIANHQVPSAAVISQQSNTVSVVRSLMVSEVCREYVKRNVHDVDIYAQEAALAGQIKQWTWTYGKAKNSPNICGEMVLSYSVALEDQFSPIREKIVKVHHSNIDGIKDIIRANNYAGRFIDAYNAAANAGNATALLALENEISVAMTKQVELYKAEIETARDIGVQESEAILSKTVDDGEGNQVNKSVAVMKKMGFAVAGAFYLEIAKTANAVREGIDVRPKISGPDGVLLAQMFSNNEYVAMMNAFTSAMQPTYDAVAKKLQVSNPTTTGSGAQVSTIELNEDMWEAIKSTGKADFLEQISHALAMALMEQVIAVGRNNNSVTNPYSHFVGGNAASAATFEANSTEIFTAAHTNYSVITQLKDKGDTILNIAGMTYVGWLAIATGATLARNNVLGKITNFATGIPAAILSFVEKIGAFVLGTVTSLVVLGIFFAVVMPMMPFMIWLMGVLGLLILIIESLVASVIWAVMMMHPSGEGVTSDQSRQGLMILMMLFFRPSLMLMGLICGIYMIEPMIGMVNDMFYFTFKSTQRDTVTFLFIMFGVISIYCMLILNIIRKTFSLIHLVPDRVLRWISGPQEQLGESEMQDRGDSMAGGAASRATKIATLMKK